MIYNNLCDICASDKSNCSECKDHPEVRKIIASLPKRSYFREYNPVCPRGYTDCVCDPAYMKYHHPGWYMELYGDKTPEEAIHEENGCMDRFINDPDEEYYCYDDEDK